MKKIFYPLAVAALLAFFGILITFEEEAFRTIDQQAANAVSGNRFFELFTIIGDQWFIVTAALVIILILWVRQQNWRGIGFVLIAVGGGNVLNQLLKNTIERERPDFPHGMDSFSFPSGNAMVGLLWIFTAAYFLTEHASSRLKSLLVWSGAVMLTVCVGMSRVAVNAHYFSDVLAGWLAGYAWFVTVVLWYEWRKRNFLKEVQA